MKSKPIEGWMAEEKTGKIVDDMADYIQKNIPEKDSLLLIHDLLIVYSLAGRDSFRGVPFNFGLIPGKNFPVEGKELEETRNQILKNLPDWAIIHSGPPVLQTDLFVEGILKYLGLEQTFQSQYKEEKRWGPYVLLKRSAAP